MMQKSVLGIFVKSETRLKIQIFCEIFTRTVRNIEASLAFVSVSDIDVG
jgi:hypothetical protein